MSTGYEHIDKGQHISFRSIDRAVRAFDIVSFTSGDAAQANATRMERFVTLFGTVRPILVVVSQIQLIPAAWRVVLKVFITTLDDVSAGFKAGKDLATGPVDGTPYADMEPKLPVG
jgi:hypothetical protein